MQVPGLSYHVQPEFRTSHSLLTEHCLAPQVLAECGGQQGENGAGHGIVWCRVSKKQQFQSILR